MKAIKNFKYFLVCCIVLVFEMTVGKYIAICGTVPMLSFCLCLAISTKEDNVNYIVFISVAMGALLDLLSTHGFGSYTVTFAVSAWVTYNLRNNVFSSKTLFLICDTFVLSVVFCIFYFLFHILDVGNNFWLMLSGIVFPTAIYNLFVSVMFYWILKFTLYKRR